MEGHCDKAPVMVSRGPDGRPSRRPAVPPGGSMDCSCLPRTRYLAGTVTLMAMLPETEANHVA